MRLVINHLIWHHHLQPRRQHGAYLLLTADNGPPNKEIYHRPQVYYYRTVNQFSLDPVRRLQRQPAFALIRSWLALGDQALFFFFFAAAMIFALLYIRRLDPILRLQHVEISELCVRCLLRTETNATDHRSWGIRITDIATTIELLISDCGSAWRFFLLVSD